MSRLRFSVPISYPGPPAPGGRSLRAAVLPVGRHGAVSAVAPARSPSAVMASRTVRSRARAAPAEDSVVVEGWGQLIDLLFGSAWNPTIGRFRSPFAFRGQTLAKYGLPHRLALLAGGRRDVTRLEAHLLRNFRKYAHGHIEQQDRVWRWLALAQHRGLPTRLLDWTYSPFVALHFATSDLATMDCDGAVYMLNFVEANKLLPARLRRLLEKEGSDTATVDMLTVFSDLASFDSLARGRRPFVLFLEPPSLDPRIVNQFSLFSLMPGAGTSLDDWLAQHPRLARRITIPGRLKWEIRDKLDQANINERTLFPGLDGLSRWLTRYYWPRGDNGRAPSLT
jgi:hypothetical protein